jgi:putative protease
VGTGLTSTFYYNRKRREYNLDLLCPAGSFEALKGAVENGADAVYLGGKEFNARKYANNFDNDELKDVVRFCHIRGAKVYLTLNTLINDNEISNVYDYISKIYPLGIDAVIVQDLAVAKIVRKYFPSLKLHASTQMTIYNLEGVKVLEDMGFSRVVLARELSYEEIKYICKNTNIEIEVFIHGALCICYSGQCLMSSFIGGRSGNRGSCAQPCRLPYKIQNQGSRNLYLLSPKDLCLVKKLEMLKEAGVHTLKIEGRMKSPEYVVQTTKIYRKYIDFPEKVSEEDYDKLIQIYNRGGFTEGCFSGIKDDRIIYNKRPNNNGLYIGQVSHYDVNNKYVYFDFIKQVNNGDTIEIRSKDGDNISTIIKNGQKPYSYIENKVSKGDKVYRLTDIKQMRELKKELSISKRKVNIYGFIQIKIGEKPILTIWDEDNNCIEVSALEKAESANNKELAEDDVKKQLMKLGGTSFIFKNIEIEMDKGVFCSLSSLNNLRRKGILELEEKRAGTRDETIFDFKYNREIQNLEYKKRDKKISVSLYDIELIKNINLNKIDRLYVPLNDIIKNVKKCKLILHKHKDSGIEIACVIPKLFKGNDININDTIDKLKMLNINTLLINNISHIKIFNNTEMKLIGDYDLNVFNNLSAQCYFDKGLTGITISPELSLKQILQFKNFSFELECMVYGYIQLMTIEAGIFNKYLKDDTESKLIDRKGVTFPIKTDEITKKTYIYNSLPMFFTEIEPLKNSNVNSFRISFTEEDSEVCSEIINIYHSLINGYDNGFNNRLSILKEKGFTNGHYKRGV